MGAKVVYRYGTDTFVVSLNGRLLDALHEKEDAYDLRDAVDTLLAQGYRIFATGGSQEPGVPFGEVLVTRPDGAQYRTDVGDLLLLARMYDTECGEWR